MAVETHPPEALRFGAFAVDLRSGELRKKGVRIKIQEQPFRVLTLLLQRPGEVISRDELRSQIWHSDTFVDFDNGLNTSINRLREALGDSASNPRFIETLPKRGYRFIAPVSTADTEIMVGPEAAPVIKRPDGPKPRIILAATVVFAIGILAGSGFLWHRWRSPRLTDKDTIVVADFTNATGDSVFDGTLRRGLAVELEQSPFFGLLPEQQIQQTLRLMRQPRDTRLTPEVAREVCQRVGSTVVINGSISQIGTQYSLVLSAVDCSSGKSIASTEAYANDKSHVLEALGTASHDIRLKLGESRTTIERFDTPLVQATTSSLEALRAYNLGYKAVVGNGDSAAAIPLFQQAVKLDPNFAMAYALLGSSYWNVGENTLAAENTRKAFKLRADLTEWEKLRIDSDYDSIATGDLEKGRRDLEVWAQTYPRDCGARNHLGVVYTAVGQQEKELAAFLDALSLCPQSSLIRGNLIFAYIALNRVKDAQAVADEAKAKNPDSPALRVSLYRIAFLKDDAEQMKRQVDLATGRPGLEDALLWNEAATSGYFGHIERSRNLERDAVASALRAEEKETAAGYESDAAVRAALFGYESEAKQKAASSLRLSNGADTQYRAALALVFAGDAPQARALSLDVSNRFSQDTIVQHVYLPIIEAALDLKRNKPSDAIESLQAAIPYEYGSGLYPAYFRGLAYLAAHRGTEAAPEFQKIIDHRGIVLNAPIGALAHLQIGRAFVMQGDLAKAQTAYQEFLNLWKTADSDIPVLKQAKIEYTALR